MNRGTVVVLTLLAAGLVVSGLVLAAVLSGSYNIAADVPHSRPVRALLEVARVRSIRTHAQYLAVPDDLSSTRRVSAGASEYAEMCSQCHLAPGMEKTEISRGLYPAAPELARGDRMAPAEQFWVIKHGIKFTSMPAWGNTHDDDRLWDIVAFIRQLPTLSPRAYKAIAEKAPEEHEKMMHGDRTMTPGMETPASGAH